MEKCKCIKCYYEWLSRTYNPKECPKCKTRKWKKEKIVEDVF